MGWVRKRDAELKPGRRARSPVRVHGTTGSSVPRPRCSNRSLADPTCARGSIGKTARATVMGGECTHPPLGHPPRASGVIVPTPVSEGVMVPTPKRSSPDWCRLPYRGERAFTAPATISSRSRGRVSTGIGRPCLSSAIEWPAILAGSGATCLAVVFDLHAYRNACRPPGCGLTRGPAEYGPMLLGYRFVAGENRTPRMPECGIAPLRAWSLKYVTLFAPDILVAARNGFVRLDERQAALVAEDAAIYPLKPRPARGRAHPARRRVHRRAQNPGDVWRWHCLLPN